MAVIASKKITPVAKTKISPEAKKNSDVHKKAATHHEAAARFHIEAAKYHEEGNTEKAHHSSVMAILHKIERVKELLIYDELNLTEIAFKLHYSSVAHLSTQFKKTTGLTPSFFKQLKHKRLISREKL